MDPWDPRERGWEIRDKPAQRLLRSSGSLQYSQERGICGSLRGAGASQTLGGGRFLRIPAFPGAIQGSHMDCCRSGFRSRIPDPPRGIRSAREGGTPRNTPSAVRKGGTPGIPLQGLIPHPQERQWIPADPSGSRESPILHPSGCGAAPRFPSRNKPWRQHGIPKIPLGAGIPELIQTQNDP